MLQKLLEFTRIIDGLDITKDAKNLLILKTMSMLLQEELNHVTQIS